MSLLSLTSVSAFAALSPKLEEWGKGPAQWIMTKEEKRAWGGVKTDEAAINFIDLFWARRDPSEGTPENQYRDEFDNRVAFSDKNFNEPRKRGAMSERGRFYIILGPATNMSNESAHRSNSGAGGGGFSSGGDPTGGRQQGAKNEWVWSHEDALKYGMPQITAVFIEDPITKAVTRDPLRSEVMGALPVAINTAIVHPEMKELPSWAARGGLDPHVLVMRPAEADVPVTPVEPAKPVVAPGDLGASRFTLVKDVFAIATETKADPFSKLSHVTSFTRQDELGWVAQYCIEATEAPLLKVTIKITGEVNGETVNMNAPTEEVTPDRIRATPGCWLLRGAIPAADMDPATYKFKVTIEDAAGKSYNLTQDFKVE
ncbi:MAG TPA: GWxTD domain-containing protein [Thermoanaerobaculia bacterium]|nr:GWxTD domain-containing protein [Thermoanaerobaculia bacterium]